MMSRLREERRTIGLLFLAALVVYLPACWWGLPHATAPDRTHSRGVDDEAPLGTLAQIHDIVKPKEFQNLGYPLMHPFLCMAAYLPYLAWLWLSGGLTEVSSTYPFGLADVVTSLWRLGLIARLLSVLLGAGTVALSYLAARSLWDRRSSIRSAVFVLLLFPMFYYSRTGNVDVPTLFFSMAGVAVYASSLALGFTPRRGLALGLWAGLAAATKESAAAVFLAMPLVLLARQIQQPLRWREPRFWGPFGLGLVGAVAAYSAGSGLLVDFERFLAHLEFMRERMQAMSAAEVTFARPAPGTLEGQFQLAGQTLATLVASLNPVGLLLALAGAAAALRRRETGLHLLWPAVTVILLLFLSARLVGLRHLLPASAILAVVAGRGWQLGCESPRPAVARLASIGGVVAIAWAGLWGVDLTREMLWNPHRAAAAWIRERAVEGDRLEYFGPTEKLPPLPPGVESERALPLPGPTTPLRVDRQAANEVLSRWSERPPEFVVLASDFLGPHDRPFGGACPPDVFAALESGRTAHQTRTVFRSPRLPPPPGHPPPAKPPGNPQITVYWRGER